MDERTDVFLRRRRIHHHDTAAAGTVGAEVAAEAGIAGGGAKAGRVDAMARRDAVEPRREGQRAEIGGSRVVLQEAAGRDVVSFAYPYGARSDYTSETMALVRDAGFSSACSTIQAAVRRGTGRYELPRVHVEDCDGDGLARRLTEWATADT